MKSFWTRNVRFIVLISTILLSFSHASASEEDDKLFGAGLEVGYVAPNVWAGWQLSKGPCIQPIASFSIWDFSLGIFWNIYGSEKDRDVHSQTGGGVYGKYKKGFGMCDEVQFFLEWSRSWKWFSLGASYWHLAYTWGFAQYQDTTADKAICEWFGQLSSGELTISPSLNFGPLSIFTDQSVVIVAKERDEKYDTLNLVAKKSDLGSYHGVFGLSWSKEASEKWSLELLTKIEWASWKFIRPWLNSKLKEDLKKINHRPYGIYHITFGTGASYNLLPQLKISGNFNFDFITNYWVRKNDIKGVNGCIPYGGIHLVYDWSW